MRRTLGVLLCLFAVAEAAGAGDPNLCDVPGEAPNVILGSVDTVTRWGAVAGITAYSIGATDCNVGGCWLDYVHNTNRHPVFAQNLFRLSGGRFEQIGQSWVAHRFFALSSAQCQSGCQATDGRHLGTSCSTANVASYAGNQSVLGPRSEVNPSTGEFPFPFTGQNVAGDAIYKRLQVHDADMDPAQWPEALFFAEGLNVTPDDAAAGNGLDNASWRRVSVTPGSYELSPTGATHPQEPAIHAWAANDPGVTLHSVDVPDDGRFYVASKATLLGDGVWRYEYAIQNLSSHRSARQVTVPLPPGAEVTNLGFHDVDYHSGEVFDGTDWPAGVTTAPDAVVWSTQTFEQNPVANALRWGTLYNFRFDTRVAPAEGMLSLGLFRGGASDHVEVPGIVPAPCAAANDADSDTHACDDCDDANSAVWATPGEVSGCDLARDEHGASVLRWDAPSFPGGTSLAYDVIRAVTPGDFMTGAVCLSPVDSADRSALDPDVPSTGVCFSYLVRAINACPGGTGPLGTGTGGNPRSARDCP